MGLGIGRALKKFGRRAGKILEQNAVPLVADIVTGGSASGLKTVFNLLSNKGYEVSNQEELLKLLKNNPDGVKALKEIEHENELELLKVTVADRKSARETEMARGTSGSFMTRNLTPLMAFIVTIGFFTCIGVLAYFPMPATAALSKESLLVLTGVLGASFKDVVGYVFGSSQSSAKKNDMLDALRKE
jgi:hypothetical protein